MEGSCRRRCPPGACPARGTLLPCLQRRAAPRFRTGRGECQRSVPQWRGLYLLKPSVGITLVFATEGRIPPLKRLFIKEAGVAIANGLKAVNPGCYLAWSFRRLCPNYGVTVSYARCLTTLRQKPVCLCAKLRRP